MRRRAAGGRVRRERSAPPRARRQATRRARCAARRVRSHSGRAGPRVPKRAARARSAGGEQRRETFEPPLAIASKLHHQSSTPAAGEASAHDARGALAHCRSGGSRLSSTPLSSSSAHRARFHAGAFAFGARNCMRHVLKFLTRLPLPLLYALGRFAYFVAFHVLRWHRELAARNLANAFPEKSAGGARDAPAPVVRQSRPDARRNVLGLRRERRGTGDSASRSRIPS